MVVLKHARRQSHDSLESLRNQFEALQDIDQKTQGSLGDSVPIPLALHGDTLIMTAVPGFPLDRLLRQRANKLVGWQNLESLKVIGQSLGRWLNRFQSATRTGCHDFDAYQLCEELDSNVCAAHEIGISEDVLSRLRATVTPKWMKHDGQPIACSACHGELLPQNVLVKADRVSIVDFDTYESRATVYKDPARFLAYLALLSSKMKYSNAGILALAHGFLSTYAPIPEFSLLSAHVLNAMLSIATHRQSADRDSSGRQQVERALLTVLEEGFPPAPQECGTL